jgi:seryl-tRNA synthetase
VLAQARATGAVSRVEIEEKTAEIARLHEALQRAAEAQAESIRLEQELRDLAQRAEHLRADAPDGSSLSQQLAAERQARQAVLQELEALQAVHADCDFAFSTLRDQILALRRRVGELERSAVPRHDRPFG